MHSLAGTGGAISLVISNLDKVRENISTDALNTILTLFSILFVAILIEKLAFIAISALASMNDIIAERVREQKEINIEDVMKEINNSSLPHTRVLVSSILEKSLKGECSKLAYTIAWLVQVQGLIVLLSSLLVVSMVLVLSTAIK